MSAREVFITGSQGHRPRGERRSAPEDQDFLQVGDVVVAKKAGPSFASSQTFKKGDIGSITRVFRAPPFWGTSYEIELITGDRVTSSRSFFRLLLRFSD